MTEVKTNGVVAEDMKLSDLKQLCAENNLDIKGLTTKEKILNVIKEWEKKLLKKTEEEVVSRGASIKEVVIEKEQEEYFEGKKVVSKQDVSLNGREYTDIKVVGGVIHRVPKNK